MKNTLKILSFILALSFLCACSQLPQFTSFTPQQIFTLTMNGKKGESEFSATVNCSSYSDISLFFLTPEQLNSFEIKLSPDGYSVNAYGITDALPEEYIADNSCLNLIFSSLQALIYTNHGSFKKDKATGNYTADITVSDFGVSAVFSEDGLLISLSIPEEDFSATFS